MLSKYDDHDEYNASFHRANRILIGVMVRIIGVMIALLRISYKSSRTILLCSSES